LVQTGVISEAALAEVLELQKTDRRRLGDLLAEKELVEPRRLAQILSYQLSCPWIALSNLDIPEDVIELLPRELALKHTVVPVHVRVAGTRRGLYLATHDPTDDAGLAECANAADMPVKPMVAVTFEIRQALARYYGAPAPSLPRGMAAARTGKNPPAKPPPPLPLRAPATVASLPSDVTPTDSKAAPRNVVLVLSAPDRFHEQCAIAAKAVGALVEDGSLLSAAEKVKATRPVAIVVTDDIYAFDRSGLNRLAIDGDALLVVWSEDVEAHQLEPLLRGSVERHRQP
jgi:hypothetical protein